MSAMQLRRSIEVAPFRGSIDAGPLVSIVRFTLLDALRSRWLWLVGAVLAAGATAALFTGELALTERASVATVAAAPLLRVAAVLLIGVIVVAASVREVAEHSLLLALSAPLSRSNWVAGKTIGFVLLAWITALVCGLPVWLFAPAAGKLGALAWTGSLAMELSLVAGIALMTASALKQVPAAILATVAFYSLARLIGTILLLSERAPLGESAAIEGSSSALVQIIAAIMPRLDLFTQTDWLLGGPAGELGIVAAQTAVYCALVFTVTVIDIRSGDV
jgi:ABC-type transport system involved in multi-copper enzyme maturation permease subunit